MAVLTRNTTFVDGNTLSSSDLHTEFDNLYDNLMPAYIEDESSDAAAHQAMANPTAGALAVTLEEEIQQLRYQIDAIQGTTHWYTATPDDLTNLNSTVAQILGAAYGYIARPRFVYQDNDEIEIHGGAWEIKGRIVRLLDDTTVVVQPTSIKNWNYLYLDEDVITALSSYGIDTSSIRTSTTAPSWSSALNGWYNSSDRCIGAIYGDSTGIREFFHDGDLMMFADRIQDRAAADGSTTFEDVTLSIPSFSRKATCMISAYHSTTGVGNYVYWRTNGQTGTTGHGGLRTGSTHGWTQVVTPVITDSTQKIEVNKETNNECLIAVDTDGWYFPHGM